jgi:hypothetical protein
MKSSPGVRGQETVAVDDHCGQIDELAVIDTGLQAPRIAQMRSREIQIGSAEILIYWQMLDEMAGALGLRRRPRIPVPLLTPWLSSHCIGLITPVDPGVARSLIEALHLYDRHRSFGNGAGWLPAQIVRAGAERGLAPRRVHPVERRLRHNDHKEGDEGLRA